jgi:hypothetical protein
MRRPYVPYLAPSLPLYNGKKVFSYEFFLLGSTVSRKRKEKKTRGRMRGKGGGRKRESE